MIKNKKIKTFFQCTLKSCCWGFPHLQKMKTKDAVKSKGQDTKLQHAEEKYTQAKQLYDEITDELYKELPSLYDRLVRVCVCMCVCVVWLKELKLL